MEQDAAKAAPDLYTVILDNDRVRVLEVRGRPGTKAPMHSHPDSVAYMISGGSLAATLPDGTTHTIELKSGEAMFMDATSHSGEIKGTSEVHGIIVELKR